MADIDAALRSWSTTASSNKPAGATSIGSGLDDNLRQVQATVRQYLASPGSTIASAATVDLSTADGRSIPISGTSTVTGLGTEVSGLEYLLTTLGTQVWKNSSALSLPGAADITLVSGDCLLAKSSGSGNWVVPFLQKNSGQPILWKDIRSLNSTATPAGNYEIPMFSSDSSVNLRATVSALIGSLSGSQAQMESATLTSVLATPGNVNWHPGVAKAAVVFSGSGSAVVSASYNISSVTRTAAGKYTVNFITPFSSANYIPTGMVGNAAGGVVGIVSADTTIPRTTSAAKFVTLNSSFVATDADNISLAFYGDQ